VGSGIPPKPYMHSYPMCTTCPAHFILLELIIMFGEYKLCSFSLCSLWIVHLPRVQELPTVETCKRSVYFTGWGLWRFTSNFYIIMTYVRCVWRSNRNYKARYEVDMAVTINITKISIVYDMIPYYRRFGWNYCLDLRDILWSWIYLTTWWNILDGRRYNLRKLFYFYSD
jgi:hypothetical protein